MTIVSFALTMHAKKWIMPQKISFLMVLPAIQRREKLEKWVNSCKINTSSSQRYICAILSCAQNLVGHIFKISSTNKRSLQISHFSPLSSTWKTFSNTLENPVIWCSLVSSASLDSPASISFGRSSMTLLRATFPFSAA